MSDDSSHGFVVGHVVPEAQVGGPIALVQDGDMIHIDAVANTLNVDVSDEEMATRKQSWSPKPPPVTRGTLYKYQQLVSDASRGCGKSDEMYTRRITEHQSPTLEFREVHSFIGLVQGICRSTGLAETQCKADELVLVNSWLRELGGKVRNLIVRNVFSSLAAH